MSVLVVVLTLVLLAVVIAVVSGPLRTVREPVGPQTPELAELEAAREAKYREIRDTELDYRTGKLSHEDYETVNSTLRAEAVEILDRLEARQSGADEERSHVAEGEQTDAAKGEQTGAAEEEQPKAPPK